MAVVKVIVAGILSGLSRSQASFLSSRGYQELISAWVRNTIVTLPVVVALLDPELRSHGGSI